jgi:methylenetetrahydrofolate reductase (NADPH)
VARRRLAERLGGSDPVFTLEVDPPREAVLADLMEELRPLVGKVDAVNVTDSPMGRARVSAVAASHLIEEALGLETIFHLTCRDRNQIALQSEVLGALALGLRNVLTLKGDPASNARPVFEVETVGLIRLIEETAGGALFIGTGANPGAEDLPKEVARLAAKVEAGARFVQTQPIFLPEKAVAFAELARPLGVPILFGVLILKGVRQARYFNERVAGIDVPGWVLERLEQRDSPEEGAAIALEIAREIAPLGRGIHLFPMQRYDLAASILAALRPTSGQAAPLPA